MKKIYTLVLLATLCFALPAAASAAQLHAGKDYAVASNAAIAENLYVAAGSVTVSGDVYGDANVFSGNSVLSGTVDGDVTAVGGTVNIVGNVGGSVRVAGGTIIIGGTIGGDVLVAGGNVQVLPSAKIAGDIIMAAGSANIEGEVMGTVTQVGNEVRINGLVHGPVHLRANGITIGEAAVLESGLSYTSPQEAVISNTADISGPVEFRSIRQPEVPEAAKGTIGKTLVGVLTLLTLLKFLVVLAGSLVVGLSLKKATRDIVRDCRQSYWTHVLSGFALLILVPVGAVILALTIIGLELAALVALAYFFMVLFSCIISVIVLGSLLYRVMNTSNEITWKSITLGAVAYTIVGIIPVIGWVVKFIFLLAAMGTVGMMVKKKLKKEM